ncbi:MAG: hypothetical protein ACRDNE_10265 [Gaiellaceae bacterium]
MRANLVALLVTLAMFGVFSMSIYMQNVLGYPAVKTGAVFLPMTVLALLGAVVAAWTVRTHRDMNRGELAEAAA